MSLSIAEVRKFHAYLTGICKERPEFGGGAMILLFRKNGTVETVASINKDFMSPERVQDCFWELAVAMETGDMVISDGPPVDPSTN
jgi:hypothetical protein